MIESMDQPTSPPAPTLPASGTEELQEQVCALRTVTTALLAAMFVFGLAMALYLYRQVTHLNLQVTESKRITGEFQTNIAPRIGWFVANLKEFAKTNADFTPILIKYNLQATPPAAAPPATSAPKK